MTQVKLGDREVSIPKFTPFKADRVALIAKSVLQETSGEVQQKVADFTREYRARNADVITPAMAKLPRYMIDTPEGPVPRWTEEDFIAGGGVIELPVSPSPTEQWLHVFPFIYEHAREQVMEMMALIIAPNSELRSEDEDGDVDEYLRKKARGLMHECEVDQLLDVIDAASGVLRDQFAGKEEKLGNLMALFSQESGAPIPDDPTPEESPETMPVPTSQDSLTHSDTPTDGPEANPSTESAPEKREHSHAG